MKQLAAICDLPPNTTIQKLNNEMDKRFLNAVLQVDFGDGLGPILVRYTGLSGAGFQFYRDWFGTKYSIGLDNNIAVISIPDFPCGYYSLDKGGRSYLYYFQRRPHRQWKRGLSPENSSLTRNPDIVQTKYAVFNTIDTAYAALQSQDTFTLETACSRAQKLGESIINRDFAVTANPVADNDTLFLWYHGCIVGTILVEDKKILVENPVFLQEVKDTFTTGNFVIEVLHAE